MTTTSVAIVINDGGLFLLVIGIGVMLATWFADLRRARLEAEASVRVTESIAQALEILESWRPDVLVSDSSPDRDAYALVGKVHSLEPERGGRIPALALTTAARTDEGSRLLSDVTRNLPKPVEPGALAAEIARLTGRERRKVTRA